MLVLSARSDIGFGGCWKQAPKYDVVRTTPLALFLDIDLFLLASKLLNCYPIPHHHIHDYI